MTDIQLQTTGPLTAEALVERVLALVSDLRAHVEHEGTFGHVTTAALDLLADFCEECVHWLQHGPDLDAAPLLASLIEQHIGKIGGETIDLVGHTCRVCGCTDAQACMTQDGPCSWAQQFDDGTGICTECTAAPGDYYIHRNAGDAVFVKEASFFAQQGGLTEDWGKHWTPVVATSIEQARSIGERTLPRRLPRSW